MKVLMVVLVKLEVERSNGITEDCEAERNT